MAFRAPARTRNPWLPIIGALLLIGGVLVVLRPGIVPGGPGRSQSRVYEFTVNYTNIPGGVDVTIVYDLGTVGLQLPDRSGYMKPVYYASRTPPKMTAGPTTPGPGGTAVGQYQLIGTVTLYQHGAIVSVWECASHTRNEKVTCNTALPPTG